MKFRAQTKANVLALVAVILLAATACRQEDELLNLEREIAGVEGAAGVVTPIDCPLPVGGETEGETYACGVYTVPLNYNDPDGPTINLTYLVLYAGEGEAADEAIVYLAGGPGQSSILAAGTSQFGELRRERDLIFPAQRGTLFAGRLALEECVANLKDQLGDDELQAFVDSISNEEKPDRTLPYEQYVAQYGQNAGAINARCHEAFANAGQDPAQFTTANSSHDIVGLVEALGYERFDLVGTSYGTRLALETVRRHPQANIRAVVLDSPSAPTSDRLHSLATATHDMVMRVFDNCAADEACAAAYPDLQTRAAALLGRLEKEPLSAGEQTIAADDVLAQLRDLGNTRANYMPRMIAELENGETATFLALLNGEVGTTPPEGSLVPAQVSALMQDISMAGMTADNPFAGMQVVADVLQATNEENPREAMKEVVREQLADAETVPRILEQIDALSADDLQSLGDMLDPAAAEGNGPSEEEAALRVEATKRNNAQFMLNGIVCSEQIPFTNVEMALTARDALAVPALGASDALLATEVANCERYPMGAVDATYHEPVQSEVPVLILQGEFDVRTPPSNGAALAEQLAGGTLVMVPQAGHEVWTGGCVTSIAQAFLADPESEPDLTCLEGRQERFSLPGEPLE